jgi:predicted ATPase/transcriptional regulator with XRE-family HTH domain
MPSFPRGSEQASWPVVLRALREARGLTQEGWGARLGYSDKTVRRWERGETVPDAAAEVALLALLHAEGLLRQDTAGSLHGRTLTAADLQRLLQEARSGKRTLPRAPHLRPASPPATLPVPLTRLIGREQELAEVTALLGATRLLTLTGPGGTGKTRLAIAAATRVADRFPEGVWFVDLSGLVQPAGVIPAIAYALGVRESEGRSLALALAGYLQSKQLLLVLDNFEQVLAAALPVYDLLVAAPAVRLLVTSRVVLRVDGEQEYAVAPLPLPEDSPADPALLRQNPAVQLFLDRAQARAVRLDLSLTAATTFAIGAICRRLDGLPLAIELAAARVRILPPAQLLARLERRLPLLTGGLRSAPARQQTLRATIQWSWDLLSVAEQTLYRRLAVFAGGFTLEAAEAVCNLDGALDVLAGLTSLEDQSLVRQQVDTNGTPRFSVLATLQEFALEQLDATGEGEALRRGHAAYLCALAEAAQTAFWQRGRYAVLLPLIAERENLLAALHWLLLADARDTGLRLAGALQMYWYLREPGEGLRWTETFLARTTADVPRQARGACHLAAWSAATAFGKVDAAFGHAEQACALLRGTPGQAELAQALGYAAIVRMASDAPGAQRELDEARDVARATGTPYLIGTVALLSAYSLRFSPAPAEALPFAEEALRIAQELGAEWLTAVTLMTLGDLAELRGDLHTAHSFVEQALPLHQLMENRFDVALTLTVLAFCEAASGAISALATWRASLAEYGELGNRQGMVTAVLGIAALLAVRGDAAISARLLGAVEAEVGAVFASPFARWAQPASEQAQTLAHNALSADAFAQAWAAGQALSLDQVVKLALAFA